MCVIWGGGTTFRQSTSDLGETEANDSPKSSSRSQAHFPNTVATELERKFQSPRGCDAKKAVKNAGSFTLFWGATELGMKFRGAATLKGHATRQGGAILRGGFSYEGDRFPMYYHTGAQPKQFARPDHSSEMELEAGRPKQTHPDTTPDA